LIDRLHIFKLIDLLNYKQNKYNKIYIYIHIINNVK
jgi:hypothetical protein